MGSLSNSNNPEETLPLSENQVTINSTMVSNTKECLKMDLKPPSKVYSFLFWSWALSFWVSMFIGALHGLVMKGPIELYRKRELWEQEGKLTWWAWLILAIICVFFAYCEGYRGFQIAWSPMLVKRSYHFSSVTTPVYNWTKIMFLDRTIDFLVAPILAAGHICGTRRRLILSWSITIMVVALVVGVSYMPEDLPWKSFIDIGVVIGLGWGGVFILVWWIKIGIFNIWPDWVPNEYPDYLSVRLPENILVKSELTEMKNFDKSMKEVVIVPSVEKT